MKVWIDVLTPKHALFFEPLYRDLARDGHQLLLTTRTYREAQEAIELKRLRFHVVGEHGGASRYGKLLASGRRVVKLAQLIETWRPDTAVSFSSPEAARVAFGLGVPHVAVNDSPHSWLVARLSIPLSRYVCSPWIIRREVWLSFGGTLETETGCSDRHFDEIRTPGASFKEKVRKQSPSCRSYYRHDKPPLLLNLFHRLRGHNDCRSSIIGAPRYLVFSRGETALHQVP